MKIKYRHWIVIGQITENKQTNKKYDKIEYPGIGENRTHKPTIGFVNQSTTLTIRPQRSCNNRVCPWCT